MNFIQLTTFDLDFPVEIFEPWDDWKNKLKNYHRYVLSVSLYFGWKFSLSLWSSIIPN